MNPTGEIKLIDQLLSEQQSLSAAERFAQAHENADESRLAKTYQELIPFSAPKQGEQYSFEVDLGACSGCKACVTACHSLNGLDEGESWRDVGNLYSSSPEVATLQTVTTACHHCADPACANGCPTLAYEKEQDTGIVRHLDDQCIGCQYCTMTCPYDVPKYNERLGIVRKCDMCQSRLKEGEAPACVQACPNKAIRIKTVSTVDISNRTSADPELLPGTAPSFLTGPSTQFVNLRPNSRSADDASLSPSHGHFPLAMMLTLTQVGAGMLLADVMGRYLFAGTFPTGIWHSILAFTISALGLSFAVLHLGRPLQAWRSFLGWRKSWLSREILVFGPWAGLAAAHVGSQFLNLPIFIEMAIALSAVLAGLLGVFCSVMVYAVTGRPFWGLKHTGFRFFATLLGIGFSFTIPLVAAVTLFTKILYEIWISTPNISPFSKSAQLINGPLLPMWTARLVIGLLTILSLLSSLAFPPLQFVGAGLGILGEIVARSLFFRAVVEPKMPGRIANR